MNDPTLRPGTLLAFAACACALVACSPPEQAPQQPQPRETATAEPVPAPTEQERTVPPRDPLPVQSATREPPSGRPPALAGGRSVGPFLVQEGNTCGLPPKPSSPNVKDWQRTCCNGRICEGGCFQFPNERTPQCICGDLRGGCSAPQMCCPHNGGCVPAGGACGYGNNEL